MFNISFLNSGIILFSLAALIPILIYLFAKKKPQKIIFSSLRYIKASTQQKRQKMNLKNILLLLIRILIILLTILAIARPALKFDWLQSSDSHPKTAIAIIVDNSYSMDFLIDSQTALAKAKDYLGIINSKISEDDITLLLSRDAEWNKLYGNLTYGKLTENTFSTITISPNPLPLAEMIKIAETKLEESDLLNREIIIISDGQAADLPLEVSTPTFYISCHNETNLPNISVQNSSFSYNLVDRSLQNNLGFTLNNHSNSEQTDLVCRLFLDGNSVAEKVVDLQANQARNFSFSLQLAQAGWHQGFVEVINERLTYDNKNYFSFYHNPDPKLGIISKAKKLPHSLTALAEIYSEDFELVSNFQVEELEKFDALIFYDPPVFSAKAKFTLDKISSQQGILFIGKVDLSEDWKSYLSEKFEMTFISYYQNKNKPVTIKAAQKFHPITADLSSHSNEKINDFWQISATKNILLEAENSPLVLQNEKSIFWAFDPASMINPFLVDAAFPLLAYNSLLYTQSENITNQYQTGDRFTNSNTLIMPNGNELRLKKIILPMPGIFRTEDTVFAVNIPLEESDFTPLNYKGKIVLLNESNWQNKIITSRYGFEIWKILLLLVILLIAAEMLIVKLSERKSD